jgi:hypothetical protein
MSFLSQQYLFCGDTTGWMGDHLYKHHHIHPIHNQESISFIVTLVQSSAFVDVVGND